MVTADLSGVLLSCPQFSHPGATFLSVGAFHLEITKSSVVEVVLSGCEVLSVDRTSLCPFDALATEQVPTSGLHWVRDQL